LTKDALAIAVVLNKITQNKRVRPRTLNTLVNKLVNNIEDFDKNLPYKIKQELKRG
jgi:hypothetical protein